MDFFMRQSKREISDPAALKAILDDCAVCRVGLADGNQPYIIPMNYGYIWNESGLTLYFHCAREGRKLDILAANPHACFELDRAHELKTGELACQYSMNYESIIGFGSLELVEDPAGILAGLDAMMNHYSQRGSWTYDEKVLARTAVLRLRATSFTGKRLNK
jgi:nitroimidazol reductase NimA-like FMN-containing flavoprotein (pyridoxamine 5'-phosphate oxidase superfamily)